MTMIAVKPRVFKNYLLKVGADNFEQHVSSFKLTPTTGISAWKGGTPAAVFSDVTAPTWVADLKVAQDWETPGSLAIYLLANAGQEVEVEFSPLGAGPKFTVTLVLASPEIGGDIDAWGESTVQCAVQGIPSFTPAVVIP